MTLAEELQNMMHELKAIKHMNSSIKIEIDKLRPSIDGIKKIATLIGMIDNLNVPDIVCAFEDVDDYPATKDFGGMA
jgi:hypothetical protein